MSAKDWYLRQSQRDRLIVIVLLILIAVSLLYAVVWRPLISGLDRRREVLVKNQSTISLMLASEAQAKLLRGTSGAGQKETSKPPYLLIDDIVRRRGMKNPDRVEPIGRTGARVNFSSVEFDKLMLALGELEQYGLKISTLNISRKTSGMVGARFRIDQN